MMTKDHYVFVYGTLKRDYPNNIFLKGSHFVGKGFTVKPFYMCSFGLPVVVVPSNKYTEKRALQINGEVYLISNKKLRTLDDLEQHPDIYRRTLEEIEMETEVPEGNIIQAYIYMMKLSHIKTVYKMQMNVVKSNNKYTWTGASRLW